MRKSFSQKAIDSISILLIFILLLTPNRLSEIEWRSFTLVPVEALFLGLLLLIPYQFNLWLRIVASVILAMGIIMKVADLATYQVFARPFNPIFDAYLLVNGMQLLQGAIGQAGAIVVALVLLVLVFLFAFLSFMLLKRTQQLLREHMRLSVAVLAGGILASSISLAVGWNRTSILFYDQLHDHIYDVVTSVNELKTFRLEVDVDASVAIPNDTLFAKLKGKDVLLIFIESYGRTVLDKAEFAEHVRPVLEKGTQDLTASGIYARSAYLTSPTVGGISWLAHGTALSGLWINSQVRYDSLVMSKRPSLNRLFQRAGWRTAAVMPAITMAWPEGRYFGYDQIYAANDLGYKGKAFNWVTMPDQYTLSAYQQLERKPGHKPVMTEMALISSHAPWTPIPTLVDWSAVGDGQIFNAQASSGDTPETVWQDDNRIREQYRKSIEYALADLVSFAQTYGDDNLVILAFGDHQPAPLVTGETNNRDVIVHLIARDPKIMEAVADWQWTQGMLPAPDAPVWKMDQLRPHLIDTFSTQPPQ